jgi:energy-coupling factor transporter ATP-binding protein EcfA2
VLAALQSASFATIDEQGCALHRIVDRLSAMFDGGSWILPAAGEAYKHREEILSLWESIVAKLFGEKKTVAFTGHAGAGKTVLFDHLTGTAFKAGYVPPQTSRDEETGKIAAVGKRIRLVTIPGQNAPPRFDAIQELFSAKHSVTGVVHVVANGFVETRDATARAALINDAGLDTTEKYRAAQLESELKDLDETCELVRQAIRQHRTPKWMVVAVTKVDLFYAKLDNARTYYSPHGTSAFAKRLAELQEQVGHDNFQWTAVPVCCWLEDFVWSNETTQSTLKPQQRDTYVYHFGAELKKFC